MHEQETTAGLELLGELLTGVRVEIERAVASSGVPDLEQAVRESLTAHPLPPPVVLPLAACAAAGGEPSKAVRATAACTLLMLAVRWFDDLQDDDRADSLARRLGVARASNLAAATLSLAWTVLLREPQLPRSAPDVFGGAILELAGGQARDLRGGLRGIEDHFATIRAKTGAGFELATRIGALFGASAFERPAAELPALIEALASYGRELGVLLQLLDDLDGSFAERCEDLRAGRVTMALVHGLCADHVGREELRTLVDTQRVSEQFERVRELLVGAQTHLFLRWAALEQRKLALAALERLPAPRHSLEIMGRHALELFLERVVADIKEEPTDG